MTRRDIAGTLTAMELISKSQQARLWSVSTRTIDRLVDEGMPCHRVGNLPRFDPSETIRWVKENKAAPVAGQSEAGASVPGEEGQPDDTTAETANV